MVSDGEQQGVLWNHRQITLQLTTLPFTNCPVSYPPASSSQCYMSNTPCSAVESPDTWASSGRATETEILSTHFEESSGSPYTLFSCSKLWLHSHFTPVLAYIDNMTFPVLSILQLQPQVLGTPGYSLQHQELLHTQLKAGTFQVVFSISAFQNTTLPACLCFLLPLFLNCMKTSIQ